MIRRRKKNKWRTASDSSASANQRKTIGDLCRLLISAPSCHWSCSRFIFFLSSETSTVIGPTLSGFFFRSSAVIGPKRRVLDAVTVVVCFSCGRLMRPFVPLMSKLKSKPSPPLHFRIISYLISLNLTPIKSAICGLRWRQPEPSAVSISFPSFDRIRVFNCNQRPEIGICDDSGFWFHSMNH